MRHLFLPLLLLAFVVCAFTQTASKKKPRYDVSGMVLETRSYCGGAAPSFEQLHPKPLPVIGAKLYIKKGNTNQFPAAIIDSITTDTAGKFSLSLPPGDYCLVEAPKKGKLLFPPNDQYSQWDTACYRKNYEQCDYLLSVKGKTSDVQIVFSRPCPWHVPCRNYSGPLPPMAHPAPQEKPPHQE